jgi:hypothetical protein
MKAEDFELPTKGMIEAGLKVFMDNLPGKISPSALIRAIWLAMNAEESRLLDEFEAEMKPRAVQ